MSLSKKDIVNELSRKQVVEKLVSSYRLTTPYIEDLCQDIYVELLSKDDELIEGLYYRDEIYYYIRRMLSNNINSTTSPFFKNYEKFRKNTDDVEDEEIERRQELQHI